MDLDRHVIDGEARRDPVVRLGRPRHPEPRQQGRRHPHGLPARAAGRAAGDVRPSACMSGTSPASRQSAAPAPSTYRSEPLIRPAARADHTNPLCGLITSCARNGSHRPIRIVPRIRSRAVRASGVPLATAVVRYRSTGAGSPSSSPAENAPARQRTPRAARDPSSSLSWTRLLQFHHQDGAPCIERTEADDPSRACPVRHLPGPVPGCRVDPQGRTNDRGRAGPRPRQWRATAWKWVGDGLPRCGWVGRGRPGRPRPLRPRAARRRDPAAVRRRPRPAGRAAAHPRSRRPASASRSPSSRSTGSSTRCARR